MLRRWPESAGIFRRVDFPENREFNREAANFRGCRDRGIFMVRAQQHGDQGSKGNRKQIIGLFLEMSKPIPSFGRDLWANGRELWIRLTGGAAAPDIAAHA